MAYVQAWSLHMASFIRVVPSDSGRAPRVTCGRGRVAVAASPFAYQVAALLECIRPLGLMDKASAPGAGDSRFESWAGHLFACASCSLIIFRSAWPLICVLQNASLWNNQPHVTHVGARHRSLLLIHRCAGDWRRSVGYLRCGPPDKLGSTAATAASSSG